MDEILRAPQEEFPLHTQRKGRAPSAQGGREKAERAGERFRKLMEAGAAQGRVFRLQGIRVYHRTRSAVDYCNDGRRLFNKQCFCSTCRRCDVCKCNDGNDG